MHYLILGNDDAKEALRAIARDLRNKLSATVDCYFDDHLVFVNHVRGFPKTDFLILGLCANSLLENSPEFAVEAEILTRATNQKIPCGIICNERGFIYAPYLNDHYFKGLSARIRLVVKRNDDSEEKTAAEMFSNARILTLEEIKAGAQEIADAVDKILHSPRLVTA